MNLRESALADLVEKIMDGERYPKNSRIHTDLVTLLREDADAHLVACAICQYLFPFDHSDFKDDIRKIVTDLLRDSHWHDQRESEMRQELDERARHDALERESA